MATLYIDVNNETHNYNSLRCSIPKMKSVVMEFCILDNKKKMLLTVYIFPMKLFSN